MLLQTHALDPSDAGACMAARRFALSVVLCLCVCIRIHAVEETGADQDHDVVAVVNGVAIHRRELSDLLIQRHGRQTLAEFVDKEIVGQEAAKAGIAISRQELDERVEEEVEKMRRSSKQDLEKVLRAKGQTLDDLKRNLAWVLVTRLQMEALCRKNDPTDEARLQKLFESEYGGKVEVRHIMVRTKEDAEGILDKLRAGADFATMAEEHSIDRKSRRRGGLLPPFGRGRFPDEFEEAAFSMGKNQLSGIVRTKQGYHIIKKIRDIPAEDVTLESKRDELLRRMDRGKVSEKEMLELLFRLRAQADYTIRLEDGDG